MATINQEEKQKINWGEIAIYYLIAVGLSAPFRLGWIKLADWFDLPFGLNVTFSIFRAIGPFCGFLVAYFVLKSKSSQVMSLLGAIKGWSVLAFAVIPICFTVLGMTNDFGLEPHYFGFLYGVTLSIYALFEEFGWRGYLQSALKPLPLLRRVLFIGLMWFVWHLNFLRPGINLQSQLIHLGSILLGSWGLLVATEKTKSLFLAASIHLSFNLFADVEWSNENRWITLGMALVVWVLAIRSSEKNAKLASS
jgi:membrane protease YdiL (CAAX protease family)